MRSSSSSTARPQRRTLGSGKSCSTCSRRRQISVKPKNLLSGSKRWLVSTKACRDERNGELHNRLGRPSGNTTMSGRRKRRAIELRVQELASLINKTVGHVQIDPFENTPLVAPQGISNDINLLGKLWNLIPSRDLCSLQITQSLK
jgi:hypothetical protein